MAYFFFNFQRNSGSIKKLNGLLKYALYFTIIVKKIPKINQWVGSGYRLDHKLLFGPPGKNMYRKVIAILR